MAAPEHALDAVGRARDRSRGADDVRVLVREPVAQPPVPRQGRWAALALLVRPQQLTKNLLVLAAPFVAGALDDGTLVVRALLAALAFALAAAAVYAVNDVHDVRDDRRHPRKRYRPVASGALPVRSALVAGAVLALSALAVAAALGPLTLLVVALYLTTSSAYVLRLRAVPVLDVVTVASGFVLRALAGAAATSLPVSDWFLLVTLFGSLFLVCAKRRSELVSGSADARRRSTLGSYTTGWLDQVITLALTGTTLAYATWAFQLHDVRAVRAVLALSVAPVLVALLRYLLLVDHGEGERPESLVRDRLLVACSLTWAGLLAVGLYAL